MSAIKQQFGKTGNLLRALEAVTNWRALTMLLGALLAFILLVAIGAATNSKYFISFMLLIGVLELIIGMSATGFMLMDQARGLSMRSHMEAVLAALFSIHRLVGAVLLILLTFLLVLLTVSLLLLPCKIPNIGPVLYTIVFPLSSVIIGVALIALFIVGPTILLPAIWEGHGVIPAMARLWTIARKNLLLVVLSLVLLSLLVGVVGAVLFGLVQAGLATTSAMAVSIIGYQASGGLMGLFTNLMAMMGGFGESAGGFMIANLIGVLMLNAIAASITTLIWLSGACHIYLQSAEDLDFQAAESRINQRMEEAKRRAQEAQARAQQAAQQVRDATSTETATGIPSMSKPVETSQLACPKCNAAVTSEDIFCGSCGHRLQA